jgi:hypothetical protein
MFWFRGIKKIAADIAAWKGRIAIIVLGQTFNAILDWFFNNPLYGYVIERFGLREGYFIMTAASFLVCLALIRFYDWLKVDWLGIEVAKEAQEFGPVWIKNLNIHAGLGRILWWPFSQIILLLLWAVNKGGFIAFTALSIYTDPFITTVYMRKGWGEYNGLSKKDWMIFLASTFVSNAYWSIRVSLLLNVLGMRGYIIFVVLIAVAIIASVVVKKRREKK